MTDFVHLHLHSEYSLLDGACRIKDIPLMAKAAGHKAVALTDHGTLYGAVAFYKACKNEGIKPIIGCEVYVAKKSRFSKDGKADASGNHLILLVENETGYLNLIKMVSLSFTEGFYSKPRIDLELLSKHHEGLIALSACLAGAIPQAILEGDMELAVKKSKELDSIFGRGNFYLEIQDHSLQDDRIVCRGIRSVSEQTGIPLVATNDVHYLRRADADSQAVLMCIQTNRVISEGRPIGFETDEFYYKSTEEMERLFPSYPDALSNTVKIADRCNFDFTFGKFMLPSFPTEGGISHKDNLTNLAYEGLEARIRNREIDLTEHPRTEYTERIAYELSVIDSMGFNEYFLIVRDFVRYAKTHDIPVGPGRGSGAGSLVAYCIGITDVDSVRFHLLFERFLNPERISMPDFDIDFCNEKREQVIAYVREKYGDDHVSQIVTFGTLAARAAVRDVGRALGMQYSDVDRVAVKIPAQEGTIREALENAELKAMYDESESVRRLLDTAMSLEGMPRHASTHAAGIVITEKPVSEYVPLSQNGNTTVTQYDMDTIAALGLVKFDFLGIRYLTVIDDAEKMIRKHTPDFDITKIDYNDPSVYKMFSAGKTLGVFQMEKNGMRQVLRRMKPTGFEDIIATIALYRPGPMDSINTFIARKHGEEPIVYPVPELSEVLDVTYGCIVYQEQVMQIFRRLAGYSLAKADLVRRAMSKKKADVMEKEMTGFLEGTEKHGIPKETAVKLFNDMASFANYAFNRNHAAAYAVLVYRTAYLKAKYPREYMAALLTSVIDRSDKIAEYITECSRDGIQVFPPDLSEGEVNFSVCEKGIRFGLLGVKGVGRSFLESAVAERKKRPFTDFADFIDRIKGRELNRRQVEALIKCGAFDFLGETRNTLCNACEPLISASQQKQRTSLEGQLNFFSQDIGVAPVVSDYPKLAEFPKRDMIDFEREYIGISFSGNPLDEYSEEENSISHTDIITLRELAEEKEESGNTDEKPTVVTILGAVTSKVEKDTKNGSKMAFVTITDRVGEVELILFPKQYATYASLLEEDSVIAVIGELSVREGENPKIIPNRIRLLKKNGTATVNSSPTENKSALKDNLSKTVPTKIFLRVSSLKSPETGAACSIVNRFPGTVPVVFYDMESSKYSEYVGHNANGSDEMISALRKLLGEASVVIR